MEATAARTVTMTVLTSAAVDSLFHDDHCGCDNCDGDSAEECCSRERQERPGSRLWRARRLTEGRQWVDGGGVVWGTRHSFTGLDDHGDFGAVDEGCKQCLAGSAGRCSGGGRRRRPCGRPWRAGEWTVESLFGCHWPLTPLHLRLENEQGGASLGEGRWRERTSLGSRNSAVLAVRVGTLTFA